MDLIDLILYFLSTLFVRLRNIAIMNELQETAYFLGIALTIGLLIGIERGWKNRNSEEGGRVAGVRSRCSAKHDRWPPNRFASRPPAIY